MKKILSTALILGTLYFPSSELVKTPEEMIQKHKLDYDFFLENQKLRMDGADFPKFEPNFSKSRLKSLEDKIVYKEGMKIRLVNEKKEIKIPTWKQLHVQGKNMCSQYARKLVEKLGYTLQTPGDSWVLHKYNPSIPFSEDSLKFGDLVTLKNKYTRKEWRNLPATHTVVYLGKDEIGKEYFAEQRGSQTKISTKEDLKRAGMTPFRIIKTSKKI